MRTGTTSVVAVVLALLLGCGRVPESTSTEPAAPHPRVQAFLNMPHDETGPAPALLSETGAFADTKTLSPTPGLVAYELNAPFWSDGASKRRWFGVPTDAEPIHFTSKGEWTFPVGTVFVKHFELAGRRVETRILVRPATGGVFGFSFQWRDDQLDAERVRAGHREDVRTENGTKKQSWYFPGPDDCRKCHLQAAGYVLGINARQLNRAGPGGGNQLVAWSQLGLIDRPVAATDCGAIAALDEEQGSPESRARSYLDANCGYCHRPGGAAADFDACFHTPLEKQALIDAPARINFGIDRARQIAPNDPWRSMVLARVKMREATQMPPLAHELMDRHGAEILRQWIATLSGPPVVAPPSIEPKGGDFREPVRVQLKHADPQAVIRFTVDGSPPGATSPVYEGPVLLANSTTIRARAFRESHTRSIVINETYVIDN
jgi:uncharacterized repeat protein (TIGR03806 family)